jgi:hypothetical protein
MTCFATPQSFGPVVKVDESLLNGGFRSGAMTLKAGPAPQPDPPPHGGQPVGVTCIGADFGAGGGGTGAIVVMSRNLDVDAEPLERACTDCGVSLDAGNMYYRMRTGSSVATRICRGCYVWSANPELDPLDAVVDGETLRNMLARAEQHAMEEHQTRVGARSSALFTAPQREALSAHWSAELRRKVAASKAADDARRPRVVLDCAEDM